VAKKILIKDGDGSDLWINEDDQALYAGRFKGTTGTAGTPERDDQKPEGESDDDSLNVDPGASQGAGEDVPPAPPAPVTPEPITGKGGKKGKGSK
jgi:hypothetical protein